MIQQVIARINSEMNQTFDEVFNWFECESNLLHYKPANNSWTVAQILEHITLTNHFLMVLIRKGVNKAIEKSKKINIDEMVVGYDLNWNALKAIGEHQSFEWNRPAHMEPLGNKSLNEIKATMQHQLTECLELLHSIRKGEGILNTTTMSVNSLGKIDVYYYLYFLVQHARRHLMQMEKNKIEFLKRR